MMRNICEFCEESGAVESEVVNPGPSPRVNPLEKLKGKDKRFI